MNDTVRFEFRCEEMQHLAPGVEWICNHAPHLDMIAPFPFPLTQRLGIVPLRQTRAALPLLQLLQPHPVQRHVVAAGTAQQDHSALLNFVGAQ
jgi:hypothetical protein